MALGLRLVPARLTPRVLRVLAASLTGTPREFMRHAYPSESAVTVSYPSESASIARRHSNSVGIARHFSEYAGVVTPVIVVLWFA